MTGGGPKYEPMEDKRIDPDSLLLDSRKERIDEVVRRRTRTLVIVLDRLEDAFNMAAVLRTSEAMGLQEVHVIEHPEFRFKPNGTVTQGCDKWLDITVHKDFSACRDHLKGRGYKIWASGIRPGASNLYDLKFDERVALVFGNERYGCSAEVLDGADGLFWIPMRGFSQSLNVSAAVSASISRALGWRVDHGLPEGDLTAQETEALTARFQMLSVKQRKRIYKTHTPG